jgi:hypothetical protein
MIINKRISFLKYYNETKLNISSIQQNIKTIYKLQNNSFYVWDKFGYNLGEEQDFYYLEKNNSYIIISINDNVNYQIDIGQSNESYEFIVNKRQICLYKGGNLKLNVFKNNIINIYKVENSFGFLVWNSFGESIGEIQDFNEIEDGKLYYVVSKTIDYSFWPPFNFNRSQSINSNNVNWGLLEHIK